MREETLEGETHEDCGLKFGGFELSDCTSIEEESESESKEATMAYRCKAETGGSHLTASMYLDCGNLWTWGGSGSAVITIVPV